jgi:hypothetical protein
MPPWSVRCEVLGRALRSKSVRRAALRGAAWRGCLPWLAYHPTSATTRLLLIAAAGGLVANVLLVACSKAKAAEATSRD